jgi:3-deoxy-7-phosphoheptulonate synthase
MMVESYLNEGNQPFPRPRSELQYGVSITDACLAWDVTERMLRSGAETLAKSGAILVSAV